jgi:hypothetical protein
VIDREKTVTMIWLYIPLPYIDVGSYNVNISSLPVVGGVQRIMESAHMYECEEEIYFYCRGNRKLRV